MNRKLKLLVLGPAGSALLAGAALAASSPTVSTGTATKIKQFSAVLNGAVTPNGASTGYAFNYGLTPAYGLTSRAKAAGHGKQAVAVHASAANLLPGTVYHYRLVALSRFGLALGRDRHFTTSGNPPPTVATGPATQVTANSATLTAVINPRNEKTTYYFRYGTSAAYTLQTIAATVPAGKAPVNVAQTVPALASLTLIHYQVVAVHAGVVESGADATLLTLPNPAPVPRVRARTRPRRARFAPYVYTTKGRVIGPSSIPQAYACTQAVLIRFFRGKREVASTVAPLAANCTYSAQTTFTSRPGRPGHGRLTLNVRVRFLGNGYLAPASAKRRKVTLG